MRISKRYGLIFLPNPKCASTTVERYIDQYTDREAETPPGVRHMGAALLDDYIRDHDLDLDDYLVFTSIRNPWDRLVSLWSYARGRPDSSRAGRRPASDPWMSRRRALRSRR